MSRKTPPYPRHLQTSVTYLVGGLVGGELGPQGKETPGAALRLPVSISAVRPKAYRAHA